jgi:putative membrane protein
MTTQTKTVSPAASPRSAVVAILGISIAASLFLLWLIYLHPAADAAGVKLAFLPALNALLNGLSATALLIGYTFIRAKRIAAHRAAMFTAFGFSTLFLVSYILHHALHGDVKYPDKPLRVFYWLLLGSHISLATIALPLVLTTFFFSLSGRIPMHRKIARWTFPIWLYVSITGVITYVMLRLAMG